VKVRGQDLVVAGVTLALCAAAFWLTFRFQATTPAAMMEGMGAEFFPRLVIGVIAVLAICIALGFGNPAMARPAPVPGIVWVTMVVLAAYVALLAVGGMWLTSFALMVGLGRLWGEKSWPRLAITSAVLLGTIYFVFVKFLKGGFPAGALFGG
jgi:hypothetical protein